MTSRTISYYLAAAVLVLSIALAAGNWYLQPERAMAWGTAVLVLGGMSLALLFVPRRSNDEDARRHAADAIRSAIVLAGLMMAFSLAAKLATTLGAFDGPDFSRRATMVILAAFFVFTGNALPKTLTPLSALQCSGAKTQAFQRFAGRTWVLTGLAFAIAWLVLPLDLAKPVSIVLLMGGMLVVMAQVLRLRRTTSRH